MDKQFMSPFRFKGYKVDTMHFMINSDCNRDDIEVDFNLETDFFMHKELPCGKVTIHLHVFENAEENNYPFELMISITGDFESDNEEEARKSFQRRLELNGTTALFPFLRSVVSDVTKSANIEPLVLPLMNLHKLIEQRRKATKENSKECD